MRTPEEYRKNPIFGTDFSKPVSVLIDEIRNNITKLRGTINDIEYGYPIYNDRIKYIEGYLTTGLVALSYVKKEIAELEIKKDEAKLGKSLKFSSRGIGKEDNLSCFVCGQEESLMSNIAAFVKSKEEGSTIVTWFGKGARLDWRPSEPEWIQVKVGACKKHIENLKRLDKASNVHGVIRKSTIEKIQAGEDIDMV